MRDIEGQTPDEVGGETAGQDNNEDWKMFPILRSAIADGHVLNGCARVETIRHAGAHDSAKGGDPDALDEIEFTNRGLLLRFREFTLFGHAGHATDHYPQ